MAKYLLFKVGFLRQFLTLGHSCDALCSVQGPGVLLFNLFFFFLLKSKLTSLNFNTYFLFVRGQNSSTIMHVMAQLCLFLEQIRMMTTIIMKSNVYPYALMVLASSDANATLGSVFF